LMPGPVTDFQFKTVSALTPTGSELVRVMTDGGAKILERDVRLIDIAALAAGLISGGGLELIESGTISSPVEYLDLDLPSGYSCYRLIFSGIELAPRNELVAAVSVDGGATFISDQSNFDTYRSQSFGISGPTITDNETTDALLYLLFSSQDDVADRAANLEAFIEPGKAGKSFTITSRGSVESLSQAGVLNETCAFYNIGAVVPVVAARINAIRISPYGNGDINPPTSNYTITAGSYFLYGIPTP